MDAETYNHFASLLEPLKKSNAEVGYEGTEEVEGKRGVALNIRFPDGYAYIALVFLADYPRPMGATPLVVPNAE